ncbi:Gfo/Idh/MocA family oxidoreductase [Micromonospora echinospora]|uniref:Gfo/Idh/MocA family protein n=1 Tax=Micromonospora echinospora TaxID=1877 RepID=UPI00341F679A
MRLVMVGAGAHGVRWIEALRNTQGAELVGIVDTDATRAAQARDRLAGEIPVGSDLLTVASTTGADAIVNVTPPQAHHEVTLAALASGLAVLGEKPMAASLAEALQLMAASAHYDRLFMVSQSYRYNRNLGRLRRHVETLGAIGTVCAELYRAVRPGGFREAMAHPFLVEMAVHLFDSARFLLRGDPVAVYCDAYRPDWSWYDGAAAAAAVFEMTGGTRLVCHGSWCADGEQTPWDGRWLISGQRGTASWNGWGVPRLDLGDGTVPSDVVADADAAQGNLLELALQEFLGAVRTGQPPQSTSADNLMSLAMVHAALVSATSGRRVVVSDLLQDAHEEAMVSASPEWRPKLERMASARTGLSMKRSR